MTTIYQVTLAQKIKQNGGERYEHNHMGTSLTHEGARKLALEIAAKACENDSVFINKSELEKLSADEKPAVERIIYDGKGGIIPSQ